MSADAIDAGRSGSLWNKRDFMLLWSGQVVSTLGSSAAAVIYPLLILAITDSPGAAGVASAARRGPERSRVRRRADRRPSLGTLLFQTLGRAAPLAMALSTQLNSHVRCAPSLK